MIVNQNRKPYPSKNQEKAYSPWPWIFVLLLSGCGLLGIGYLFWDELPVTWAGAIILSVVVIGLLIAQFTAMWKLYKKGLFIGQAR